MLKISDIRLVDQDDQLIRLLQDTRAGYPEKTIHGLFNEQAALHPDRIAVTDNKRSLTYRQLAAESDILAAFLQEKGIQPETIVGLLLQNSANFIVAILGVLKAGAAYLPMDPEVPYERIRFTVRDAGVPFLIGESAGVKVLNRLQWDCEALRSYLCIDSDNIYAEKENPNELMGEDLWDYIGENAYDDISGGAWFSSYTGEDLTRQDMDEYAQNIHDKLLPYLHKDARVLEIGCSSGISMFRIAPYVQLYYGTDMSGRILEKTSAEVMQRKLFNVVLKHTPAHNIDKINESGFDIVILNSVVQCFEGHNYFRDVIRKAIGLLKKTGIIFLGDIQDQDLKEQLEEELTAFKQQHVEKAAKTKTDWSNELFLARQFLDDLVYDIDAVESISYSRKIGTIENELTKFRFDCIVNINKNLQAADKKGAGKSRYQYGRDSLPLHVPAGLKDLATPSGLAYVIYTSGSTGQPKGCMITHGNVVRLMKNDRHPFSFSSEDVWIMVHAGNFDFSVWEIYGALLYGGKLIVPEREQVKNAATLFDLVARHRVTILNQTPFAFYYFLEEACGSAVDLSSHLRYVIFGGDRLQYARLRKWVAAYPLNHIRLINMYGITETTVHVTYYEITDADIAGNNTGTIGRPIPETTVYILNEQMNIVPVGVIGEMYIGGTGVCRGYLNRTALTAERFIDNPFRKGERLYKTGDRGKLLADGNLEYHGRVDDQLKIRGFRIEPGEIQLKLKAHPGIRDVWVYAVEDKSAEKRLEAVFTLNEQMIFPLARLISYKYSRPELFRDVYELPNGMVIFHKNKSESDHTFREIFKNHTYLKHGVSIKPGDTIFDLGANIGMFSLFAGLHFPGVTIHAFEPLLPIYRNLEANVSLYDLNVRTHHTGLSDHEGEVTFSYYPHNTVISGRYASKDAERDLMRQYMENRDRDNDARPDTTGVDEILEESTAAETWVCRVCRLSDFIRANNIGQIDLLKIDVEKSEADVIKGIDEDDWGKIRQVVIEVQDTEGRLLMIQQLLQQKGFRLHTAQDEELKGTNVFNIYAVKDNAGETPAFSDVSFKAENIWTSSGSLVKSIQSFAAKELPAYMVPVHFKIVEEIPLTPNRKLDIRALAKMPDLTSDRDSSYVAPANEVEETLAAIWESILGKNRISTADNFFELGGHSLKATRVLSAIHEVYHKKIKLGAFFRQPTIAGLADLIAGAEGEQHQMIRRVAIADHYPVSHSQQRLWVLNQFEGTAAAYNIPGAWVFEGVIDLPAFEKAIRQLMERHEILRTTFISAAGMLRQLVHAPGSLPPCFEYVRLLKDEHDEVACRILAEEEALRPFDLEKGPLLRIKIYELNDSRYLFLFTIHHIIADAWSVNILMREMTQLYNAFADGQTMTLPPLPVQYKDYAAWQLEQLSGPALRKHQQYWHQIFSGELPVLDLPADYPRPPVKTFNGHTIQVHIDRDVTAGLATLSRQYGASLFMVLLATVKALLFRYCGQQDIIVGSTIAGRDHKDLEELAGFFINVLPLRTNISPEDTFATILEKIKTTTLGAYEHQLYPFDKLVDDIAPDRDLSRSPMFDVLVEMINVNAGYPGHIELAGLQARAYHTEYTISKYDVTFRFQEDAEGVDLVFEYNRDLFKPERMENLLGGYSFLLQALTANADIPVGQWRLYDEQSPGTHCAPLSQLHYPTDTVVKMFRQQVLDNPGATAVGDEAQRLTYRELDRRSDALAAYLSQTIPVGDGCVVAVLCRRSVNVIAGLLGILKSGAAFLPVDPQYPAERIRYMLQALNVSMVLIDTDVLSDVSSYYQGHLFDLELQLPGLDLQPPIPLPAIGLRQAAYVIYTSGSTGLPKAVCIEHGGFSNYISWANRHYFENRKGHTFGLFTSLSFDLTITSIFSTLTRGDELRILPEKDIHELIADQFNPSGTINAVKMTPSHVSILGQLPLEQTNVTTVILGGEPVKQQHVDILLQLNPGMQIWNEYGPTEATVGCTVKKLGAGAELINIGRPIDNTAIYICDEEGNLLPAYFPGEIYIAGAGVARGYLNDPEKSARQFVKHPALPGWLLYRSGDVGYRLPDGDIMLHGRKDEQVKIRGNRIEPGEIMYALATHEQVKEAYVSTFGEGAEKQLVAYVVKKEEISEAALFTWLRSKMPSYMVPGHILFVEAFPLTENGKIDRRLLPLPGHDIDGKVTYVSARNELERKLVAIWEEVLEVSAVGVLDDFFALGGHSLKATSAVSRIHKQLHVKVTLDTFFNYPTVAGIAAQITSAGAGYEDIQQAPVQPDYPVSHAQRRLWVLNELEEQQVGYNIPGIVVFENDFNVPAFEKALFAVVERHEVLRTAFVTADGYPRQRICNTRDLLPLVSRIDLKEHPDREQQLKIVTDKMAAVVFNLKAPPLFKAVLVTMDADKHVLLFTMHHIIADGWSMHVLIREMLALYNAFSKEIENPLKPLRVQYKDYAVWQEQLLGSPVADSHKQYWLDHLKGELPVLELPLAQPRPAHKTMAGARYAFSLDKQTAQQLEILGRQKGVTQFMMLFALVRLLLYKYTGQKDMIIGTPVAGRDHVDLEGQIGFYVNTVVLRTQCSGEDTFTALLASVKDAALNGFDHQLYPFDKLVDDLHPERDTSRSPVFDVMVTLQDFNVASLHTTEADTAPGEMTGLYNTDVKTSKFDLTFDFSPAEEGVLGQLEYSTDLFTDVAIARMVAHLQQLVQEVVNNPDGLIANYRYLSVAEQQQLVYGNNPSPTVYPETASLPSLFAAQAVATPEAIAFSFEGLSLSYRELDERSNQLGHYLREQAGVKKGELVCVLMDRSAHMMVTLLGIHKAGAAYVPIDIHYPAERIRYILTDTGSRCLLADDLSLVRQHGLSAVHVITLADLPAVSRCAVSALLPYAGAEELAYVLYTSGSTGVPKGVMVRHGGVVNRLHWMWEAYGFDNTDIILQKTPYVFDVSVWELFMPLCFGARLVMCRHEVIYDPVELAAHCERYGITAIHFVPGMLHVFLQTLTASDQERLRTLRRVIASGEALSSSTVGLWYAHSSAPLYNLYGPTEASIDVTHHHTVTGEEPVPIGRPVANMRLYILDEGCRLAGEGIWGQIGIAGIGLATGYLNQPELSADRFREIEVLPGLRERIYLSGDKGRWLPGGIIAYGGRLDSQVKLRGHRIELKEIESVLQQYEGIVTAVAALKEDKAGEAVLIAYIVSDRETDTAALHGYLSQYLPGYMLPSGYVQLERIPFNANGKIDYKALPLPEQIGMDNGDDYTPPSNETEILLCAIMGEILNREKVSTKDSFFSMGGDSIKAIQVAAGVSRNGYKMTTRDLFQYPKVADLAAIIKKSTRIADQQPVEGELPLTPIQHAFFGQVKVEPHHYNHSFLLHAAGPLDAGLIEQVFNQLLLHHDALRIKWTMRDGKIIQYNDGPECRVQVQEFDLSNNNDAVTVLEQEAAALQQSLHLSESPLVRIALFHLNDGDRLLIIIHHLVVDGVSWRILFEDMETLYGQLLHNQEVKLALKTDSYRLWAQRLVEYSASTAFSSEMTFWKKYLADNEGMPTRDFPVEKSYYRDEKSVAFSLSEDHTAELLTNVNETYKTTVNEVLLTAMSVAAADVLNSGKLKIALEGHGREEIFDDIDVSRTVGWFTAIYPVNIDFGSGQDISRRLKTVKESLRSIPEKGIGYGIFRYLTEEGKQYGTDERYASRILFNYLGQAGEEFKNTQMDLAKESPGRTQSAAGERPHDLVITAVVLRGRLHVGISYSCLQYKAETMTALMSRYESTLLEIIQHCLTAGRQELVSPSDLGFRDLTLDQLESFFN